jgi:hypothetical protein
MQKNFRVENRARKVAREKFAGKRETSREIGKKKRKKKKLNERKIFPRLNKKK